MNLRDLLEYTSKSKHSRDWNIYLVQKKFFKYLKVDRDIVYGGNNLSIINVDDEDENEETVLMLASAKGDFKSVEFLIDCGADVNHMGSIFEEYPIENACEGGNIDIVKILIFNGAKLRPSLLYLATRYNHCDIVKLLLENNADIEYRDHDSNYPMRYAAKNGCLDCINILLDSGMEIYSQNYSGTTPLMSAAKYGHPECVKILLKRGADVHTCDFSGVLPIMIADKHNHPECSKLLKPYKSFWMSNYHFFRS